MCKFLAIEKIKAVKHLMLFTTFFGFVFEALQAILSSMAQGNI